MAPVKFVASFKGERDYIQGPDIFDGMNAALIRDFQVPDAIDIKFTIHRVVRSGLSLVLSEKQQESATQSKVAATLLFRSGGKAWRLSALEDDVPVTDRRVYDEEPIRKVSVFDHDRSALRIERVLPYSDIELWVAQNKLLLERKFSERAGKWWFVQGEFGVYSLNSNYEVVELRLLHNFNFRLTKSEIMVDGISRGFIYFSMT
ncbi:hypothetical protein ASC80_02605 [Afipia sp. Root123D2]|uniref:hypothetical protein n=1 Tax=Afipia sp. Root123D2 TaxID=1736436 RepID=UPI0006FD6D56|nr:hypothetical protein [Afipia sp. Root123D2]KQW22303.1 hypothetical protein ASC80_02605 [Afipia sp. Root123D2]